MASADEHQTVEGFINWYLGWASRGKHSPTGEPKSQSAIIVQRGLLQNHIPSDFKRRVFRDLSTQDIQNLIDLVASSGDEPAALGLKTFFMDLDKFAVRNAVLEKARTRDLTGPINLRPSRTLTEQEFARTWEAYLRTSQTGDVVMRGPCLATLLSAATLQPTSRVLAMKLDEVEWEERLCAMPSATSGAVHYVHLSDVAVDLAKMAVDLGDFVHRSVTTPFMFPSAGPKRDPFRPIGFTSLFRVTQQIMRDADVKPEDLRHTGIASLKAMGGQTFQGLIDVVADGCSEKPSKEQILIVDAWARRIIDLTGDQAVSVRSSFNVAG